MTTKGRLLLATLIAINVWNAAAAPRWALVAVVVAVGFHVWTSEELAAAQKRSVLALQEVVRLQGEAIVLLGAEAEPQGFGRPGF